MKTNVCLRLALALTLFTTLAACHKDAATNTTVAESDTERTTHSNDQSQVAMQMDAVSNDATLLLESSASVSSGVTLSPSEICDATIVYDTSGSTKKIILTYTGKPCSGAHTRTGTVVLSMPKGVYWKNAGAELTVAYQNLKITRLSDNKSMTLNGSHVITNVRGGLLFQLATLQTITHTVTSNNLAITFDDGTQRTWQVAQKRLFSYNNGLVLTITGNHTEGSNTGIVAWGTNRFGHAFTTSITQPLVIKQACDFRLTSGVVTHEGWATTTVAYGLDAKGNAASCPDADSTYYYKASWTDAAGKSYSFIHAY